MKPGSVVVDLAAESGGNVEGSVAGEVVRIGNAQVWGGRNVPSQMPGPASRLYAQNVVNLVTLMTAEGRRRQRRLRARLRRRDPLRQLRHPRRPDRARADPRGDRGPGRSRTRRPPSRPSPVPRGGPTTPRPRRAGRRAARSPLRPGGRPVTLDTGVVWLTIFVLSVFVGIEVISKVSSTLHTPLMSGANAIHGIILLGAILVTGTTDNNVALVVGLIAIVLAAVNMVGGFVVTDRMLQMFIRKKPADRAEGRARRVGPPDAHLDPAGLPRLRRLLHPRAQGPLRPEDRPQRQPPRRRRRGRRLPDAVLLDRPAPPARPADHRRDRDRHRSAVCTARAPCR